MLRRWKGVLLIVLVVAVVAAVFVARQGGDEPQKFCAGVGLMSAPAATPDTAVATFLQVNGGSMSDWKRSGISAEGASYRATHSGVYPALSSIDVTHNANGTWQVTGGCV